MALKRVLGPVDAAWLVAGNMIGAGIFITPGLVAGRLPGAAWHLGAWLLGGLLALAGAAVYGELGARIPRAGGDYQYLGAGLGPSWAFLTGWGAFVLSFSAAAAAIARTGVEHLIGAFAHGPVPGWVTGVGAAVAVLGLTGANLLGARVSGRTTATLTALPLLGLAGMFAFGLLQGNAAIRWPGDPFAAPPTGWPLALGAAMLPVFFTYSGWNAAAYVAGEVREPGRNLPRGLLIGTATVTLLYLGINALLLATLPTDSFAGSTNAGSQATRILVGAAAEPAFSLCVAVAVLGSANVTLMAGARVYYAMAVDRLAPAPLARVSRRGVPHVALWAGGVWSAVLALTGTVSELVNWATLAILLLSSATAVALFRLRRTDATRPAYRCPGYPWTPLLYLLTTLAVATASAIADPARALKGLALLLVGIPVYAVVRRAHRGAAPRS